MRVGGAEPGMTVEGVSSPPRVRAVPLKLVGGGRPVADGPPGRGRFLSGDHEHRSVH